MTRSVLVYGAGGHGRVVADAALGAGLVLDGFLDDRAAAGMHVLGLPVRPGLIAAPFELDLAARQGLAVLLGVGDNAARATIAALVVEHGLGLVGVVHATAAVSLSATLGEASVVLALAAVSIGAEIGRGVIVNTGAVIEHDVVVGDFAHVSPHATLCGGARLGSRAQLGAGAVVVPGKSVGEGSVIGAGAVVTDDVPPRSFAAGVPARVIRSLDTERSAEGGRRDRED